MAGTTPHYQLITLGAGDDWDENGYQFSDADRRLIDLLLYLGAEGHHHTGDAASAVGAPTAPTLTLIPGGGALPGGERFFYKVTIIDENGLESAASTEVYLDTPDPIASPAGPTLTAYATGGTLLPGNYFYVLTAYTTTNTQETPAIAPVYVTIPTGSSTNRVELLLPTLPTGADGINIYRRKPGGTEYDYLASVAAVDVADPFIDDGSIAEDCNRAAPDQDSSGSDNAILVEFTDTLDSGQTWKVYRTDVSGDYVNSLLYHVVEETSEGSGIITVEHEDLGDETSEGQPPATSQSVGTPEQIDLATEVQGILPAANMEDVVQQEVVTFGLEGTVEAMTGTFTWVCEYPSAQIIGVRAALGRGSTPAAQPVIVDVLKGTAAATPVFTSIFTVAGDRPTVEVGDQIGDRALPTGDPTLVEGQSLVVDIIQGGGGGTPTDEDLTVTVFLHVDPPAP